ncbi:sugar ABC transporter permease [Nocardiopsis sp. RSe5-2]|uniref:Sugar ABC transporter permease n=1 Tax=Nocardiopsis endophytica TaxID=3018445 RepID=A0ABT4UC88_9ACTN|nr:sugar ABC transporter permease [Nocardiopsis endophytica]MDA2813912.1 sugar ABC transporter permease [Nocardiopsis endophytica]
MGTGAPPPAGPTTPHTATTRTGTGTTPSAPAQRPSRGAGRAGTGRRSARRRELVACGVLMAPFFVLLAAVFLVPVGTAVWLSLFADDRSGLGFGPPNPSFVGLRSYLAVLADPTFTAGLGRMLLFCLIYIPLLVAASLVLALLLDSGAVRLRAWAQLGLYLPHTVPGLIAAVIWLYLYTPGISPVIDLLSRGGLQVDLLGVDTVLPSLVNVVLWSNLGYNTVIFYTALRALPREVVEASVVDGAGPVRTALLVKTPQIRSAVVTVVLFSLIFTLQLFTEPMLLGQSTSMIDSRFSPSMYIFDAAFNRNSYGLAAAASVVLLACTIALSYAVTRWTNRSVGPEEER